jgi:hypothetical protein
MEAHLFWQSMITVCVSLFFLGWAMKISYSGSYQDGLIIRKSSDDGLLCFPFTILTGLYGILLSVNILSISQHLIYLRALIVFSFSLTVAIYINAAVALDSPAMHESYLIISAVIWGTYGGYYWYDTKKLIIIELKDVKTSRPSLQTQLLSGKQRHEG